MSEVKVNKLSPRSGTTVTIGDSGDTINLVGTIQNNGSPLPGDISSVVAGTGLSGGGTTGAVTLNIESAQPTITSLGTITGFTSTGIDDNATETTITIDSDERVKIVSGAPTQTSSTLTLKDDVATTTGAKPRLGFQDSANTYLGELGYASGGSSDLYLNNIQNANLIFSTNNAERMRLNSTGLAIGTTSHSSGANITLSGQGFGTVGADSGSIAFGSNTSYQGRIYQDNASSDFFIENTYSSGEIAFKTNSSERMRLTNTGLGIGTTSPDGILHLDGGTNTKLVLEKDGSGYASLTFHNDGTQTSYIQLDGSENMVHYGGSGVDQIFYSGGSERMRIVNNTVMVGKTSAGGSTNGVELKTNDESRFTQTSRTVVAINRLTDDGNIVEFKKDNTTVGSIGAFGGNIVIGTNDTGLRFNPGSSSDYITPFNISSYANSSNAISLGHPAITFKDIYLGGGAFIGGTGSSNKLDDYEEGTWTPAIATAGGTLSVTYAERTGKYTKIGNVVYYEFYIETSAFSGGSGNITFSAFPFTAQAGRGAIGLATGSRIALGLESAAIIPDQNATTFKVRIKNSTGTGSSDNLTTLDASDWSNLNPTILYGAGYYRTDS